MLLSSGEAARDQGACPEAMPKSAICHHLLLEFVAAQRQDNRGPSAKPHSGVWSPSWIDGEWAAGEGAPLCTELSQEGIWEGTSAVITGEERNTDQTGCCGNLAAWLFAAPARIAPYCRSAQGLCWALLAQAQVQASAL